MYRYLTQTIWLYDKLKKKINSANFFQNYLAKYWYQKLHGYRNKSPLNEIHEMLLILQISVSQVVNDIHD